MTRFTTALLCCIAINCAACADDTRAPGTPQQSDGGAGGGGEAGGSGGAGGSDVGECITADDCGPAASDCQYVDCHSGACVRGNYATGTICGIQASHGQCAADIVTGTSVCVPGNATRKAYTWIADAGTYLFDSAGAYASSTSAPQGLVVNILDVAVGDTVAARVTAGAYGAPAIAGVRCSLQIYAATIVGGDVTPELQIGGAAADFIAGSTSGAFLDFAGMYAVTQPGILRVRLLGRTSDDDRPCGIVGPIELVAIHSHSVR